MDIFVENNTKPFYLPRNEMPTRAMIPPIFTFLVVICSTAHGSLQITNHEYPLMHITELTSEEMFTPALPLVAVLPSGRRVN